MVEKEKTFPEVLDEFEKWREKENLTGKFFLKVCGGRNCCSLGWIVFGL